MKECSIDCELLKILASIRKELRVNEKPMLDELPPLIAHLMAEQDLFKKETLKLVKNVTDLVNKFDKLQAENERLRVQLAGCGVAAMRLKDANIGDEECNHRS